MAVSKNLPREGGKGTHSANSPQRVKLPLLLGRRRYGRRPYNRTVYLPGRSALQIACFPVSEMHICPGNRSPCLYLLYFLFAPFITQITCFSLLRSIRRKDELGIQQIQLLVNFFRGILTFGILSG